jgi:hypothetical protein
MSPFGGGSTEAVDLLEKYSGFNQHKVPHVMQVRAIYFTTILSSALLTA